MNLKKATLGQLYFLARYTEYRTAAQDELTYRIKESGDSLSQKQN